MGTGAVYVTLAGLKVHPGPLTNVETFFFFINLSLFILNSSTLLLQAICTAISPLGVLTVSLTHIVVYPRQSKRLICDPVKGVFVPLLVGATTTYRALQAQIVHQVLSFATIVIGIINYGVIPGHVSVEAIYVLFW
jgi:hypothetical protein